MQRKNQKESIRKLVVIGMLVAVTVLLANTPIGLITLPPPLARATTVHIPVLIAVLVEGPVAGMIVGLAFGLCSLISAWQTGSISLTLFFRNPLISVVPRILFPLIAYVVYRLLIRFFNNGKVRDKAFACIAAVIGTIANTVLCLGLIALIYGGDLTEMINSMVQSQSADAKYLDNAGQWLIAAVGIPNGTAEAIVAGIIVPVVKIAVDAVLHRGKKYNTLKSTSDCVDHPDKH